MSDSVVQGEWALVQFKPNSDAVACRNLSRQGFEIFLPRIEVTSKTAIKFVRSLKPLFPGYLFVRINTEVGGWRAINSTYGVSRIVTTAGKPTRVPDELVDDIKRRCDSQNTIQQMDSVKPGDEVSLKHGPFADWVGKVVTLPSDNRVWVLLEILGRQTRVAVGTGDLSKV